VHEIAKSLKMEYFSGVLDGKIKKSVKLKLTFLNLNFRVKNKAWQILECQDT